MLFSNSERRFAETVSKLAFCNPFLPERVELEKEALGKEFDKSTRPFWSWSLGDEFDRPNVLRLTERVMELTATVREKIAEGHSVTDEEFELYDDLALYVLYYQRIVNQEGDFKTGKIVAPDWGEFQHAFEHWMNIDGKYAPSYKQATHVFAYLYQLKRAFFNIFHCVVGRSWPIARLRARIFESIFTHNRRRCRRVLYERMNEVTTLVVGATGTGKELVARAVGLSQYMPFDLKSNKFETIDLDNFVALNLSAFSPTLIESELFGHEKGSFTGADTRRIGWLESCGKYGTVFLDEIGELDLAVQVKLLRVLQNRQFQRIGENRTREFQGKFIAATNRNLFDEIQNGNFREDFYYRLCSDVIQTPTLVEQLVEDPDEFRFLVHFISHRVAPDETDSLVDDVLAWYESAEMEQYNWPGNMRELEQCVRNVMVHNDYQPTRVTLPKSEDPFARRLSEVEMSAEELLCHYCGLAYAKYGSYEKAAAVLGMDRRTVRAKCMQR